MLVEVLKFGWKVMVALIGLFHEEEAFNEIAERIDNSKEFDFIVDDWQ